MIYTVNINQAAIIRFNSANGADLNYRHAVLADFFRHFFSSGSKKIREKTIRYGRKTYFWVKHSTIENDLPFFNFRNIRTVNSVIDDLVKHKIIKKRNERIGSIDKMFFAPGDNFDKMFKGDIPTEAKERIRELLKGRDS